MDQARVKPPTPAPNSTTRHACWQQRPAGQALFVFGFTASVVFAFGATADASQLVKQIRGDSAKSQKQITLSGGVFCGSSDIDCRATSTDDFNTKALHTLIIF